ncbi:hypothetical protein [Polaromonas sp.]|uniref:hypothetical protein n=1 Tax=Polaromonas sp. TaxID=1869339 RepID=UPI003BB7BFDF
MDLVAGQRKQLQQRRVRAARVSSVVAGVCVGFCSCSHLGMGRIPSGSQKLVLMIKTGVCAIYTGTYSYFFNSN